MSSDLMEAHRSWGDMNPGYSVRYFDLRLARGYLRRHYHPAFLRAFDCLEAFASKSDLFRMTLLYREGGWHSDWKQTCLQRHLLRNLTSSTDNDDTTKTTTTTTTTDFFAARDHDNFSNDTGVDHSCVVNAFVGSRPGHPVVGAFLERLLINVRTSRYGGRGRGLHGPLDATGPCLLGLAVRDANEAARDDNGTRFTDIAGRYEKGTSGLGYIRWKGTDIVQHKCADCGRDQNWGDSGNNYNTLYNTRGYYCEDAASLFITTAEGH
jgi:mannosyltransferase OCH1-like enzyme